MKTLLVMPYFVSLLIVAFPANGRHDEAVVIKYEESDMLGAQEQYLIDSDVNAYSNDLRNLLPTLPDALVIKSCRCRMTHLKYWESPAGQIAMIQRESWW